MLILGTWLSLLLYSISWVSGLTLNSSSRYAWLDIQFLRLAWLLHTFVLLVTLYTISHWPETFVGDFLSGVAWVCLVISQAFPGHWKTMNHSAMLRVFSILLLGLSTSISQVHFPALAMIQEQNWLHQTLLATHVMSFLAGYVLFGAACVAAMLFLYQEHQIKAKLKSIVKNRFPALATLDRINVRATQWGFVGLTFGMILGMMLSEGQRTGWSALRLGLSMGVWCTYAVLILLREISPAPNRLYVLWPILGFCMMLMALGMEWRQLMIEDLPLSL